MASALGIGLTIGESGVDSIRHTASIKGTFGTSGEVCVMFRMYVDETGNADFNASDDPNHRYLSLTGVIALQDHVRHFIRPALEQIKRETFTNVDPDTAVILHRKELIQKKYPFNILKDEAVAAKFNQQIVLLLTKADYLVVTATIDKQDHIAQYNIWKKDPYHYCMEVLVERYALFLHYKGARGDVMSEARGGKEDKRLQDAFTTIYDQGTSFVRQDVIAKTITSKHLKVLQKSHNIAGLQIADLLAHPSAQYSRKLFKGHDQPENFGADLCRILVDTKYNRSKVGKIRGYGLKWLP